MKKLNGKMLGKSARGEKPPMKPATSQKAAKAGARAKSVSDRYGDLPIR